MCPYNNMNYYKVDVNKTSRAVNNKTENYQTFSVENEKFGTLQEAKEWIKEQYPKCKKEKMYVDKKDGTSQHIGYIYSFKNKDWSHNSECWYQKDWVRVSEVKETPVIIK